MTRSKNLLTVVYHDQVVGHLAANPNNTTLAFEYDPAWLRNGFALSPFKLPLIAKLFVVPGHKLEGALGVFSDSLPDGWGRLLIDRLLRQRGIDYRTVSELERLAIVGASGKGALEYYPEHRLAHQAVQANLDQLAQACRRILQDQDSALLEQLTAAGSSAGGARPKIIRRINGEEWIIKFPASLDHQKIGLLEYQYSVIAKQVGITMSETRLFNGKYFGTKRFDRQLDGGKVHMLSAGALLDADYRVPALDYIDLINATRLLTKSYQEVEKLFKLMCFNVLMHNRDDHAKNFSFLYQDGQWQLSPAYDLVYADGMLGEHMTAVAGEGRHPDISHLLQVAQQVGIKPSRGKWLTEQVAQCYPLAVKLGINLDQLFNVVT